MSEPSVKKARTAQLHFAELFKSGKDSDVTVTCGDKEWHVHKLILAEHVDYFDRLFRNKEMKPFTPPEGNPRLSLDFVNVPPRSIEVFLKVLYGGCDIADQVKSPDYADLFLDLYTCVHVLCGSDALKKLITYDTLLPDMADLLQLMLSRTTPIPEVMTPLLARILQENPDFKHLMPKHTVQKEFATNMGLLRALWASCHRRMFHARGNANDTEREVIVKSSPLFPVKFEKKKNDDETDVFDIERMIHGTYQRICFDGTVLHHAAPMHLEFKPPIEKFHIALQLTLSTEDVPYMPPHKGVYVHVTGDVQLGNLPLRVRLVVDKSSDWDLTPVSFSSRKVDATFSLAIVGPEIFDFAPYLQFKLDSQ